MERRQLIEHLRVDHGYADEEPGGSQHLPGESGLVAALDDHDDDYLDDSPYLRIDPEKIGWVVDV